MPKVCVFLPCHWLKYHEAFDAFTCFIFFYVIDQFHLCKGVSVKGSSVKGSGL